VTLGQNSWYCEKVKNVTVSLDDATYRRARILAAEREMSLSALVKELLNGVDADAKAAMHDELRHRERELRERVRSFRASGRLPRDEAHSRLA
jgi:hypothetical protein